MAARQVLAAEAEQDHGRAPVPATEMADVAVSPGSSPGFVINVKYLRSNEMIPFLGVDSEVTVPYQATLEQLFTEVEHYGCASGRLRAVVALREENSVGALTRPPHRPDRRELLQAPSVPGAVRTR